MLVGLAFGVSLLPLLAAYPYAALAPLVALAGFSLAYAGCKSILPYEWAVVLPASATIVFTHTLYGFMVGMAVSLVAYAWKRRKSGS